MISYPQVLVQCPPRLYEVSQEYPWFALAFKLVLLLGLGRCGMEVNFAAERKQVAFEMSFLVPSVPGTVAVHDFDVGGEAEVLNCIGPPNGCHASMP